MAQSPISIPYTTDGVELPVKDNTALPANARGVITAGVDNLGNTQFATVLQASATPAATDSALVVSISPNSVTGIITGNQGAPNTVANGWPVKITDGVDTASVVASGAQAVVADSSLVVQISPNQKPIPFTPVPGYATAGTAIGRASGLNANTNVPVYQTPYVEQSANGQRSIRSTSANDTALGTGARQVAITYLNATCTVRATEVVTLNGLTAVNTVATNICFIESIVVTNVGSNKFNSGTIELYTGINGTGIVFGSIGLGAVVTGRGDNQTFWAHHYVPAGVKIRGYSVVVGIIASAGGGASVTTIQAVNPVNPNSPPYVVSDFINAAQGNSSQRVFSVSQFLTGPQRVTAYVTPANNNATATATFDYSEEPI